MTIEKTQGVLTADQLTCVRLQEVILGYKQQCPIGKVVIDAEKMTFYKFGLKAGIARHSANGIVYNNGNLSYEGMDFPTVRDSVILNQLLALFNLI